MAETLGLEVAPPRHARGRPVPAPDVADQRLLHAHRACRFGVVLTETDEIAAINFVERVREAGRGRCRRRRSASASASAGRARSPGESADALVRRADERLLADVVR